MSIFGDLGSDFSKTNFRFKISTLDKEFVQNFADKIRKLILFYPKCPNLGILAQNLNNGR